MFSMFIQLCITDFSDTHMNFIVSYIDPLDRLRVRLNIILY